MIGEGKKALPPSLYYTWYVITLCTCLIYYTCFDDIGVHQPLFFLVSPLDEKIYILYAPPPKNRFRYK